MIFGFLSELVFGFSFSSSASYLLLLVLARPAGPESFGEPKR